MSRYLEDINPGDVFESPHRTISLDEILAFAREFDSQPFHLDPEAAKHSFFGTLIASGWHTAALTMRMLNEAGMDLADGIIGAGADQLHWPAPLLPGDRICVHAEIIQVRASQSRPEIGVVRMHVQTVRDDGHVLQDMITNLIVPRNPKFVAAARHAEPQP